MGDDILGLLTKLRRAALVKLSAHLGSPLTGLSVSARRLPVNNRWRRRLRELDSTLGLVEKITAASVDVYLDELDQELARLMPKVEAETPKDDDTPSDGSTDISMAAPTAARKRLHTKTTMEENNSKHSITTDMNETKATSSSGGTAGLPEDNNSSSSRPRKADLTDKPVKDLDLAKTMEANPKHSIMKDSAKTMEANPKHSITDKSDKTEEDLAKTEANKKIAWLGGDLPPWLSKD